MKVALCFPSTNLIEIDVYFFCRDMRQISFTARATLLADYGAASGRFIAPEPSERPAVARQVAVRMVAMPFAEPAAFKTSDPIKVACSSPSQEEAVRVEILDWYGHAIHSHTQRMSPPLRQARGRLLYPITTGLSSIGARLRRPVTLGAIIGLERDV